MIILDTHVWVWWVDGGAQLPPDYLALIQAEAPNGLGVCAISCWEVAKLVEVGRLVLPLAVSECVSKALAYPGVRLLPLTPEIAIASTQLPGGFHRVEAAAQLEPVGRLPGGL